MSKKQDAFYFENFITCAGFACQEAHLLEEVIQHFEPVNPEAEAGSDA